MNLFQNEVRLFMIFDILGDTVRTGPLLWHVSRKRLESVKDHCCDLLIIYRLLESHFPVALDYHKVVDYILCHDLPEAITGDITKFEGISDEKRARVNELAIQYLVKSFQGIMDFESIFYSYENRADLESKVVNMIDKVHSASTFIKYQSERNIDVFDPDIPFSLRNHPFVVEKLNQGYDVADVFFEFHLKAVCISDEECKKYHISREEADQFVQVIRSFLEEMYRQKKEKGLLIDRSEFPKEATRYRRRDEGM